MGGMKKEKKTPTVGAGVGSSPWELPPLSMWQLDGQAILRWQGSLTLLLPHIPIADALTNRQTQTKTKTDKTHKDTHIEKITQTQTGNSTVAGEPHASTATHPHC